MTKLRAKRQETEAGVGTSGAQSRADENLTCLLHQLEKSSCLIFRYFLIMV